MRYMYHATTLDKFDSILTEGLKTGVDGVVYLAETQETAFRFISIRCFEPIIVFKVKILKADEKYIEETFDHSYSFFKCKSFGSTKDLSRSKLVACWQYDNKRSK